MKSALKHCAENAGTCWTIMDTNITVLGSRFGTVALAAGTCRGIAFPDYTNPVQVTARNNCLRNIKSTICW